MASWETFTFSLSVGRCGQLRASGWKRIACIYCISGKSEPLLKLCGSALDGSDAIV